MKSEPKKCPDCGAAIPVNAPQGLCPKCLMAGAAAATETGPDSDRQPVRPAPSLEEIADAFPQLQIVELIGRGGMGFVYRARQPKLDRDVALKILPQHLAEDVKFAERFAREGRLLAKLNHPNIVSVYDFGEAGGLFYLLMEYVDGVNLRQAMRASQFTPDQALSIVPAICEALQFAHDEGVLHRDVKPENILLDTKGRVKIADFGIAKLMTDGRTTLQSPKTKASSDSQTQPAVKRSESGVAFDKGEATTNEITGVSSTLGTPQYMAPEQIEHPSEIDHRADIYSLGVVFYELLTGELPKGKFAPPSSRTPLDERVDKIVLRALAKDREHRQQSARELKTEVETVGEASGKREPSQTAKRGNSSTFRLPDQHKPLVSLILLAAIAYGIIELLPKLWAVTALAVRSPLIDLALEIGYVGVCAWAGRWLWQNHSPILGPFGIHPPSRGAEHPRSWLNDADAALFWTARIGVCCLFANLAIDGFGFALVVTRQLFSFLSLDHADGLPAGIGIIHLLLCGLVCLMAFRNLVRRTHRIAKIEPPSRLRRSGWLFIVAGVVLVSVAGMLPYRVAATTLVLACFLTGVASLTCNRGWRIAALILNWLALVQLSLELRFEVLLLPLINGFGVRALPGFYFNSLLLFLANLAPYLPLPAGLWLLNSNKSLPAFGIEFVSDQNRPVEGHEQGGRNFKSGESAPRKSAECVSRVKLDSATACAFAVALSYAGLVVGIGAGIALARAFYGGARIVFVCVFAWVISTVVFAKSKYDLARSGPPPDEEKKLLRWMETLWMIAAFLCLPVCGLGLFFLVNLVDEWNSRAGGWNPDPVEAVVVPLTVLGSLLLPWSAMKLRTAVRSSVDKAPRRRPITVMLVMILVVVVVFAASSAVVYLARRAANAAALRQTAAAEARARSTKVDNADVVAIARPTKDGTLITKLPVGQIELVAVAPHPSDGHWWRPDGEPIVAEGFQTHGAFIAHQDGRKEFEFVWRKIGVPNGASNPTWKIADASWYGSAGVVSTGSEDLPDYGTFAVSLPAELSRLSFEAGMAERNWETMIQVEEPGFSNSSARHGGTNWSISLTQVMHDEEGNLVRTVVHNIDRDRWDLRLMAVDFAGNLHVGSRINSSAGWFSTEFRDLTTRAVMNWKVQTRPVEWVQFQNVKLPSPADEESRPLPDLDQLPPVVVQTVPQSGATNVKPGIAAIVVRFSKPMLDESWSWSAAWSNSTPEALDEPRYDPTHHTCSLAVNLEPDKTYAYWLNSENFKSFQDTNGRPAVPYLLIFHTRSETTNQ